MLSLRMKCIEDDRTQAKVFKFNYLAIYGKWQPDRAVARG